MLHGGNYKWPFPQFPMFEQETGACPSSAQPTPVPTVSPIEQEAHRTGLFPETPRQKQRSEWDFCEATECLSVTRKGWMQMNIGKSPDFLLKFLRSTGGPTQDLEKGPRRRAGSFSKKECSCVGQWEPHARKVLSQAEGIITQDRSCLTPVFPAAWDPSCPDSAHT